MAEKVIGARQQDITHQIKTAEGSLTFEYNNRDVIANTIGHLFAIPNVHLPLLTLKNIFQNPSKELADQLKDRYKDVPWKGDVLVRVGHTSIIGDIKRVWASYDEVKGKARFSTTHWTIDRLARILYIPLQALKTSLASINRSDHYDPITNTVTVFHPNLAVGMHELGHAQFMEQQKHKEAWAFFYPFPIIRSFMEWKASANAMKHFQSDEERRQALKVLEPAWATYMVPESLGLAGAVGIPGFTALLGTLTAGHFMARGYPRKEERFGYIFENKKQEPRLAPYQVLVGRGRSGN